MWRTTQIQGVLSWVQKKKTLMFSGPRLWLEPTCLLWSWGIFGLVFPFSLLWKKSAHAQEKCLETEITRRQLETKLFWSQVKFVISTHFSLRDTNTLIFSQKGSKQFFWSFFISYLLTTIPLLTWTSLSFPCNAQPKSLDSEHSMSWVVLRVSLLWTEAQHSTLYSSDVNIGYNSTLSV